MGKCFPFIQVDFYETKHLDIFLHPLLWLLGQIRICTPTAKYHSGCLHQVKTHLKLTNFLLFVKKKVEFLIKHTNLWLENVFQSAVVVGISLLTHLSAAHSFVPNRGDCKWSGGTTDGWWTTWTHETSVHLVCSEPLYIHYRVTYVYMWVAAGRGLCLLLTLKDKTQHLTEVNHLCSSLLWTEGSWQTLRTTKHLSDAKPGKLQHRLESVSVRSESWDVQAIPAQFIVCWAFLESSGLFKVVCLLLMHIFCLWSLQ